MSSSSSAAAPAASGGGPATGSVEAEPAPGATTRRQQQQESNLDEVQVYEDLRSFLNSNRRDLRLEATKAVLTQLSDNDSRRKLVRNGLVLDLARNACHDAGDDVVGEEEDTSASNSAAAAGSSSGGPGDLISLNALRALVSLSSSTTSSKGEEEEGKCSNQCVSDLIDVAGGLNRMVEIALSRPPPGEPSAESASAQVQSWRKRVNYAVALLANMTRVEAAAVELVGRTVPDEPVYRNRGSSDDDDDDNNDNNDVSVRPAMELLLSRFLDDRYRDRGVDYERYERELREEEGEGGDGDGGDGDGVERDGSSVRAVLDSQGGDPYQHFSSVLMNAAQTEVGRRFLLRIQSGGDGDGDGNGNKSDSDGGEGGNGDKCVLRRLLPELRSPNPVRRRGVAGCVRNCCLDAAGSSGWWLLNVVQVQKHLLYPLAGPEELDVDERRGLDVDLWIEGPDKRREVDHLTRLFCVEAILLLCASGRKARERLRLDRTYVVLKYADMVEPFEDVSEQINECVQYLRRDEAGTAEGSSDLMVAKAYNIGVHGGGGDGNDNSDSSNLPRLTMGPAASSSVGTTTAGVGGGEDDFDNVD